VTQQRLACRIDTAAAISSSDTRTELLFGATQPQDTQALKDRQRLLEGREATSLV
jgi:hypothetical protein